MKGPLCAHQCCPIGVGAHSGAHFCTDTHGGGALGDALGDRVMTLALWRAISQQEQPDLVLFCSWQRSWQGAGGLERCRCHGCWGFSHARTALSRERAPPATSGLGPHHQQRQHACRAHSGTETMTNHGVNSADSQLKGLNAKHTLTSLAAPLAGLSCQ